MNFPTSIQGWKMDGKRFGINLAVEKTTEGYLSIKYGVQHYGKKEIRLRSTNPTKLDSRELEGLVELLLDIIERHLADGILIEFDGPEECENFSQLIRCI